jgi:hypothetical protein
MTRLGTFKQAMVGLAIAFFIPTFVAAQTREQSITDILSALLTNQSVPTGDFVQDLAAAETTRDTLAQALLVELATIPLSSSSGGFYYRFNPSLATMERASETFGPFFAERTLGAGRGQASFGVTFQYASYQTLDGFKLRDGNFITTASQVVNEPFFDTNLLTLKLESQTLTFLGSYGITNRLDVGVAVPVVKLYVNGSIVNDFRGQSVLQVAGAVTKIGVGDMALRARYHVFGRGGTGLAAGTDVRLPTGSKEDLLGAGKTAVRLFGIGSAEWGRVASHLNAGVTLGGLSDEVNYNAALTVAATQQLTLVGEVLGRRVENLKRVKDIYTPHPLIPNVQTLRWIPSGSPTNMVFAVTGIKWNPGGSWLLNANVLIRLTDGGLSARVTPGISFDYTFGQ